MSNLTQSLRIALLMVATLFTLGVAAQNITVTGTVSDDFGPVSGATVVEKGKPTNGSATDMNGKYKVSVPKNATLVVSFVGMKSQEVQVKGRTVINVTLQDDTKLLDEVVAIGYQSVRKKDLTGAVATVNSEALVAVPVASAMEALTGKMAGVQVTTTEGSPDADVKIRVRGGGSITQSNDPLYIVDGFPVESISDIPASDIEDITVLKDASSTAIYGSRGANGVILVTTKSGKEGKVSVSYNAYYSIKNIAKTMNTLSPYDYAKWQYELALLHAQGDVTKISSYTDFFGNYQDMDLYKGVEGNDWQDIIYGRTGHTFNQNVNITGGSDAIKYAFSYAHMNDKAIQIGSNYKRDNFSLKLNTKPSKTTTLDFQARYSDTDVYGGGANEAAGAYDTDRRLKYAVIYTPIPLKNLTSSAGSADDDFGNLYNPIEVQYDNDRERERKQLNMSGAFGWEVVKNLKVKTEWGLDNYDNYDKRFWGTTTYYVKNVPAAADQNLPAVRFVDSSRHRMRNTNTVSYNFKEYLKDTGHSLNVLAGHEYVITKQKALTNEVHGFPADFDSATAWKLSSIGETKYTVDDFYSNDDKLLSWFGRVNYDFESKYLVSATFRADASSKFADHNRWGYFPSVAAAWRISSEPFMKSAEDWLDDLKLRLSYGTAGNNNIPTGQLIQSYKVSSTSWVNGLNNYVAPSKIMANPDLKWETTVTRNLGLDFTLWGGKLNGTIDAYLNTTKDLLIEFPVAGTGYDSQFRNMGDTENKGVEVSFTYHAINKKNFGLDINANIGVNKGKIKSLGAGMEDFGKDSRWASTEIGQDYWIATGGQVGEIRGYKNAGRYEVDDFTGYDEATKKWILKEGVVDATGLIGTVRPGSLKVEDLNGDGVITDDDNTIIGNVNPDFTGGFGLNARFYGFDLSANFNFSVGNEVYNANKIEYTSTSKYQYRNMIDIMADGKRWTNLNADGTLCNDPEQLKALNANTTMWSPWMSKMVLTDWAIEKASFLRLNTLTLGYTLPKSILMKAHMSSLRLYATCYNVFTITNYSGYDPESDCIRGTALTPCVDYSGYPRSRQFVFGINLNF